MRLTKLPIAVAAAISFLSQSANASAAELQGSHDTGEVVATEAAVGTPTWPIEGVDPLKCYHSPGSGVHHPRGGYNGADDLYALDLNCKGNSDSGKVVRPVRAGTVVQTAASLGWVLVQHSESITVDGFTWPAFFTGYMHMGGTLPSVGTKVYTSTALGTVSHTGLARISHHVFNRRYFCPPGVPLVE
jgi:hypothetical protein